MSFKFGAHRLEGRVAIVTDAGNAIGLAIAERVGHEGARLVVNCREKTRLQTALAHLEKSGLSAKNVVGAVCLVEKAEDRARLLQSAIDSFGRLDLLVNSTDVNPFGGGLLDISESLWDETFDVNCKSAFMLTQAAAPLIGKTGGGAIVFVTSTAAYKPRHELAAYGVMQTALLAMTKAFAHGAASLHVRVNCVASGWIEAEEEGKMFDNSAAISHSNDLGRWGAARDVAASVAYLLSDDSTYVTGETQIVSGGVRLRL